MRVTMLEMKAGSTNGIHIERFDKGETYNMPESLAKVFIEQGWAKLAVEEKMDTPAPQNKMASVDGKNKAEDKVTASRRS